MKPQAIVILLAPSLLAGTLHLRFLSCLSVVVCSLALIVCCLISLPAPALL